jgi:hypothetical protein
MSSLFEFSYIFLTPNAALFKEHYYDAEEKSNKLENARESYTDDFNHWQQSVLKD